MLTMSQTELDDAILKLVEAKYPRLKLSHKDISEVLFQTDEHTAAVSVACRRLMASQKLVREGKGVAYDPYVYRPWAA
jgi:hypothetical protein